jgi:hypothetical protein
MPFDNTRPIDMWMLVIELLVLLIIAGEAVFGVVRSRRSRAKNQRLVLKQQRLADFLTQARNLEIGVPQPGSPEEDHNRWAGEVAGWNDKIIRYLARECGEQASARFLADRVLTINFGSVPPGLQGWMRTLTGRRENLTAILDRSDVYLG